MSEKLRTRAIEVAVSNVRPTVVVIVPDESGHRMTTIYCSPGIADLGTADISAFLGGEVMRAIKGAGPA